MSPEPRKKAGSKAVGHKKADPQRAGAQKAHAQRARSKPPAAPAAPQREPAASSALCPRPTRWLLKTDAESFPFDALWSAPRRTSGWDGVRNYQARNYLRDSMRVGDLALIYHSSSDPVGVIGVARITSAARPDPTQFDPRDEHFDAKSRREAPTWWEVDVQALVRCPHFVTLSELRAEARLAGMAVLQKGQRLSVQPVNGPDFDLVLELAGVRARDLLG